MTVAIYRKLPVDQLIIDPRYQREINERHVGKIIEDFDEAQLDVLHVSERQQNGDVVYAVFDGQHRYLALMDMVEECAPCLVHTGLTPQEEADLFTKLQDGRKQLTPLDRFKARLFAGDPTAEGIAAVASEHGYEVGIGHDKLQAIVAVERVYRRGNLAETLQMLSIWKGDKKGLATAMIDGVSRFLDLFAEADRTHARERWSEVPATQLLRRAGDHAAYSKAYGVLEELRGLYHSRKHPLPTVAKAVEERKAVEREGALRYRRVSFEEVRDAAVELVTFTTDQIRDKLGISKASLTKREGFLAKLLDRGTIERRRVGDDPPKQLGDVRKGTYYFEYVPPHRQRPKRRLRQEESSNGRAKGAKAVPGTGKGITRPGGQSLRTRRAQARGTKVKPRKRS